VISANPTVRVFNDIAFVLDGPRIVAFSSYKASIAILPVSPAATVLNPAAQSNDSILTVIDGTTLWTFSCFLGTWTSRVLTTPTPRIATQRHALVLGEGTSLWGMSAFFGTWVPATASTPAAAAFANGSWGVIETPGTVYGFSAQRNAWSSAPALGAGVTSSRNEDCIVWSDASTALAYTGLRGVFASTPIPSQPFTISSEALVSAVQSGSQLRLYSAVLGSWTSFVTVGTPSLSVRPQMVQWSDGGILSAYSPFVGTVATMPIGASVDASNQGVAAAVDIRSSRVYLYSTLTGAWVAAPRDAVVALPSMIWCGALLRTSTGYAAYVGRTGRFVHLATSAAAIAWTDSNSSIIAVEDGTTLSLFEARAERWISVPIATPPLSVVRIWRTTVLAVDGSTVYGFGSGSGTVESTTLSGPPVEVTSNSENGRVAFGNTLAAFGSTSDLTTLYQFPEFRRVYALGSTLHLQMRAAPGSAAFALVGIASAVPLVIPPFGELLLEPATMFSVSLGVVGAESRLAFGFVLPDTPVLRGLELGFQGVVQPPAGIAYLTRLATVGLY
jgi:hypothetical protein